MRKPATKPKVEITGPEDASWKLGSTLNSKMPADYSPRQPHHTAAAIAQKASELIGGQRNRQHGAKRRNFENIATLWQAWLDILATKQSKPSTTLSSHDIGIMMVLMKAARTQTGQTNLDDYIDMAGYAACAGEIIQND